MTRFRTDLRFVDFYMLQVINFVFIVATTLQIAPQLHQIGSRHVRFYRHHMGTTVVDAAREKTRFGINQWRHTKAEGPEFV